MPARRSPRVTPRLSQSALHALNVFSENAPWAIDNQCSSVANAPAVIAFGARVSAFMRRRIPAVPILRPA
jgi:hypothetical protein